MTSKTLTSPSGRRAPRLLLRLLGLVAIVALAVGVAGCNATVGVGVAVPMGGPYYGPWGGYGGGVYVGVPIYP
jgi:predicted small secreted protein